MGRQRYSRLVWAVLLGSLAGCSRQSAENLSSSETHGKAVFDFHCADCHESSHPQLLKQPPPLQGLFGLKSLPSGAPANDQQVRKTILQGLRTMPAFDQRLQEPEIDDLVRYLHRLK